MNEPTPSEPIRHASLPRRGLAQFRRFLGLPAAIRELMSYLDPRLNELSASGRRLSEEVTASASGVKDGLDVNRRQASQQLSEIAAGLLEALKGNEQQLHQTLATIDTRLREVLETGRGTAPIRTDLDLIDYGNLKLFSYVNDNLYRFTSESSRGFSLRNLNNHDSSFVDHEVGEDMESSAGNNAFFVLLDHMWEQGLSFSVFDIGCHIGRFGLEMAWYIHRCEQSNRVYCFDPGPTAALMPFNIVLNGLQDLVKFERLAVSDVKGPLLFHVSESFTDNCGMTPRPYLEGTTRVESITLDEYLTAAKITGHLIVKIDTEGAEPAVLRGMSAALSERIVPLVLEFAPVNFESDTAAEGHLAGLCDAHSLFDLRSAVTVSETIFLDRPTPVAQSNLAAFVSQIRERPFGFTDVLAIPHKMPGYARLIDRLATMGAKAQKVGLKR